MGGRLCQEGMKVDVIGFTENLFQVRTLDSSPSCLFIGEASRHGEHSLSERRGAAGKFPAGFHIWSAA